MEQIAWPSEVTEPTKVVTFLAEDALKMFGLATRDVLCGADGLFQGDVDPRTACADPLAHSWIGQWLNKEFYGDGKANKIVVESYGMTPGEEGKEEPFCIIVRGMTETMEKTVYAKLEKYKIPQKPLKEKAFSLAVNLAIRLGV